MNWVLLCSHFHSNLEKNYILDGSAPPTKKSQRKIDNIKGVIAFLEKNEKGYEAPTSASSSHGLFYSYFRIK
jgi:hypothetical protein